MMEYISPQKLVDYSNNAKNHPKEQIQKLSRAFKEEGFHGCIIADENLVILAGHGRKYAAIEAGLESVPVEIIRGLTEEQKRSKRLGDNKLAESDWLDEILKQELTFLNEANYDLALSGFDLSFIQEELVNTNDPDDCPDVADVELRCAVGEIWKLSEHTLYVGDATDEASVFLLMQDTKADLIVTDPPYNINYEGKTKDALKIKNDSMSNEDFYSFLDKVFKNYSSISKEGSSIYVFHADSEGLNFRKAFVENNFLLKQCLIWNKNQMVIGRQDYQWKHEPILYGWKQGAAHSWYSDRKQTTVLEYNKPQRNGEHPTMKPIEILEYLISNSSKRDDVIVDLFGGSGSTLIACEKTKRVCKIMELDPKYASVILERWEKYSGKTAERIA